MAGTAGPTMSSSSSSLWPRLRRQLREGRKKKRKENPYASRGLETFAQLVAELQAKRLAMVEQTTTMSMSAVRSLSKSAQEWTALTLSRTASSNSNSNSSKRRSSELSHQAPPPPPDARSSRASEVPGGAAKGDRKSSLPQQECASDESSIASKAAADSRQQEACAVAGGVLEDPEQQQGSRAVAGIAELLLPLKVTRAGSGRKRRGGGLACVREKAASNKSAAVAVLVAVGAFFASKRAELVKQVAAALSFSIVVQRWRNNGKLYTRFMFSAMASYLLCPLHSYLSVVRVPKRLTLASACLRKAEDDEGGQEEEKRRSPEEEAGGIAGHIEQEQQQKARSSISPIVFSKPSSSAPSSILPDPAAAAESDAPSILLPVSPTASEGGGSSPPSANLRRKLSLKLKSRFVDSFQSSRLAPGDPTTPLNSPGSSSAVSGSDELHRNNTPGSPTPSLTSGMENSDLDTASSSVQRRDVVSRPKIGKSFSFSRKLRARSESPTKLEESSHRGAVVSESAGRRSPMRSGLNRMSTAPANEVQTFTTRACASGLRNVRTSFLQTVEDKREMKMYVLSLASSSSSSSSAAADVREIWPLCSFLVALLFLLVGRVPAILATSLFFLVLSQLQKLRSSSSSSSRGQGQEKDMTSSRRALEASRKLNIASSSSSPGSPVTSPLRGVDINSMEYRKRIIMEGLLERNRRSSVG